MTLTKHSPDCALSKECQSADNHDICPGDVIDDYLDFCIHCAVDCTCATLPLTNYTNVITLRG
jgi:hypothetical protein